MGMEAEKYFSAPVLGAAYYPEDWDEAENPKAAAGTVVPIMKLIGNIQSELQRRWQKSSVRINVS